MPVQSVANHVDAVLREAFAAFGLPLSFARCSPPAHPDLADLQCNGALGAAKAAGRNPREVASGIAAMIGARAGFAAVSVAGPGFLNLRLSNSFLSEAAEAAVSDPALGVRQEETPERVVIDFGGSNVAKSLHAGHLRSLAIGESLRRILAAQGHHVVSDVHLGDWGLQMGMLMSAIRRGFPHLPYFSGGGGPFPEGSPVSLAELERLYPEAAEACKSNPDRLAEARADTAALQDGDAGLTALWRSLREMSLAAQRTDFEALGAHFDLFLGESDADGLVGPMVAAMLASGTAVRSDGALVIEIAEPGDAKPMPPLLLEKADGAALYATTDLATIGQRTGVMGAQRIIYVVDQRQSLHFEQVFRAARKAGIDRGAALVHVGFGTVNGKDGKPYRTRQGGVARLSELIGEAVAKAEARVDESERLAAFPSAERQALSRAVGVAAVKFADLSGDRLSGYVFDVDRLVSFEGRTGPYLQYACVRIRSILGMAGQQDAAPGAIDPRHDAERDLLLACLRFPEAVSASAAALQPGVLADYAFGVAQRFSRFYAACPVLGADEPATRGSRLSLCRLAGRILERSLHLLGIEVPERM